MGLIIQLPSWFYDELHAMGKGKKSYANDRRKLNRKLKKAGIEFEWNYLFDGYKWTFPKFPNGDAVIHSTSYNSRYGHFETMGMPWDIDDVSVLTANQLIARMRVEMKYEKV